MCDAHGVCTNCNLSFCGDFMNQNAVNIEDICHRRQCSTCRRQGCPQCVPMISFEEVDDCDPPYYEGAVYKCQNNPDCK